MNQRHLATTDRDAVDRVAEAIGRNGDALVWVRFAEPGARRQWHVLTDPRQLAEIAGAAPGTSLLVFLSPQLPIRGTVGSSFKAAIADVADGHPEILAATRDPGRSQLTDASIFEPVDADGWAKLNAWLARHDGDDGVAGLFPPTFALDDSVLDLVVPDETGTLEHGFY